jgi:hypothetical protein
MSLRAQLLKHSAALILGPLSPSNLASGSTTNERNDYIYPCFADIEMHFDVHLGLRAYDKLLKGRAR